MQNAEAVQTLRKIVRTHPAALHTIPCLAVPHNMCHWSCMHATSLGRRLNQWRYSSADGLHVCSCCLQLKKVKDVPRLLHRLRTTLGSTNIHDFQQLLNRHEIASEVPAKTQEPPLILSVSDYSVMRGCSLSALLMLRDAMSEAAEQRCSLLDASAQAEQLWGAVAESEPEAADRAQHDPTGSPTVFVSN